MYVHWNCLLYTINLIQFVVLDIFVYVQCYYIIFNELFLWALKIVILSTYKHYIGTSKLNSFYNRFYRMWWFIIPLKCITIIHILASVVQRRAKQDEVLLYAQFRILSVLLMILFSVNTLLYFILIFHCLNIEWLYKPQLRII